MSKHSFHLFHIGASSSLYGGLPQVRLQPLDGVLRAAARMIGGVPKFGQISEFMRDIHSGGSLSGSAFTIGSPPFGIVSLALRLLTDTYWNSLTWLRPALAENLFARPPEVILWCLMLAQPLNSIGPSKLWVPLLRTVSHRSEIRSLPRDLSSSFYKLLKAFFLPGLGARLSSYLEVALYKFHR